MAIAPMLARASTGASNRRPVDPNTLRGYTFDVKIDGLRAIAYWSGTASGTLTLINRSGVDITAQFPELVSSAQDALGLVPAVLDGEIVGENGRFETVATRGKTTKPADVKRKSLSMPCRFMAFDVLSCFDQDVMHQPWSARRRLLEVAAAQFGNTRFGLVPTSTDVATMWKSVMDLGMEGLIAKRVTSPYRPGARTDDWLKFKTVRRITAVAVGYEPGQGSRTDFGKMQLALIGPDGPVRIGVVGSGFTAADLVECKALLDAGTPFLVEIEALNRTDSGVLRFPTYKGRRTDLPITAATLDQLQSLPLS